MANRAKDWLLQAQRDVEQAEASYRDGRHEWACFAAQQAAEKAAKALHLFLGEEGWGHVVARLLRGCESIPGPSQAAEMRVGRGGSPQP